MNISRLAVRDRPFRTPTYEGSGAYMPGSEFYYFHTMGWITFINIPPKYPNSYIPTTSPWSIL